MHVRTRELGLMITGDIFIFFASLYLALTARHFTLPNELVLRAHFLPFLILIGISILIFYVSGLYDKHTRFVRERIIGRVVIAQSITILIGVIMFFTFPFQVNPKTNLILYLGFSISLISLWRVILFPLIQDSRRRTIRALLIASGDEARMLFEEINKNSRHAYTFIQHIDPDTDHKDIPGVGALKKLIVNKDIRLIVVNPSLHYAQHILAELYSKNEPHTLPKLFNFQLVYEESFDRVPLETLSRDWIMYYANHKRSIILRIWKRTFDILGSILLLIPFTLFLPLIATLIKLESSGPVFISQKRVGKGGRAIHILKLRTMTAHEQGGLLWVSEKRKDEETNKVTRIGSFLRKTSIDEIPQCFNILTGTLSLIGPRAEMWELNEVRLSKEIPHHHLRTTVTPGITGWAQTHQHYEKGNVSAQSVSEAQIRFTHDLYYIKYDSILNEIEIILRTIKILFIRIFQTSK